MKLLVVVDMQNDFIDGVLGTPEAVAIVPAVAAKIKQYRENGDAIIYTADTHYAENYARTMGLNIGRSRLIIFLSTTLLAGSVTAFCGPIGFIGLAMPHLARITFRTADHRVLMPAAMLWGALSMVLCSFVADLVAHSSVVLPVNTITALLGVPIIIFVVLRNRNRQ
jgi:ABC-type Fe3+-siderophore transport system permease subunit